MVVSDESDAFEKGSPAYGYVASTAAVRLRTRPSVLDCTGWLESVAVGAWEL